MRGKIFATAALIAATALLSGCVTSGGRTVRNAGSASNSECSSDNGLYIAGGAALGAGVGLLLGKDNKKLSGLIGGVAGALVGKGLASYLEFRCRQIAEAQKRMKEIKVSVRSVSIAEGGNANSGGFSSEPSRQENTAIEVTLRADEMFAVSSAAPTEQARRDIKELARAYRENGRKILIIGHTDSAGSEALNQQLSEKRALEVAKIFEQEGIPKANLYYKGAGATRPVARNDTPEGRALNRRVQVVDMEGEIGILAYEGKQDSDRALLSKSPPKRYAPEWIAQAAGSGGGRKEASLASATSYAKALKAGSRIDFGGVRVDGAGANLAEMVGRKDEEGGLLSSLSIISKAFAAKQDTAWLGTACIADEFRDLGKEKPPAAASVMEKRKTVDFMPGLYSTSWADQVNGHLVGLARVAVLREDGKAQGAPTMAVFENYEAGDQKPSLHVKGTPRAYVGEKGVLYRVFFDEQAWPVRCIDVIFPRVKSAQALYGRIYYDKDDTVYSAEFKPKMVNISK